MTEKTERNPKGAGRKSIGADIIRNISFDQESYDLLKDVKNKSEYIRNLIKAQ